LQVVVRLIGHLPVQNLNAVEVHLRGEVDV
jgi:hypothetical protein